MDIENMTNDEIWQAIKTKAEKHPEYIENLDAVYGVKLTKEEEASYRIAVKDGKMDIQSKEADDADCTLILSFKNFKKLLDRKSIRLNSSHVSISYAVLCLKKK